MPPLLAEHFNILPVSSTCAVPLALKSAHCSLWPCTAHSSVHYKGPPHPKRGFVENCLSCTPSSYVPCFSQGRVCRHLVWSQLQGRSEGRASASPNSLLTRTLLRQWKEVSVCFRSRLLPGELPIPKKPPLLAYASRNGRRNDQWRSPEPQEPRGSDDVEGGLTENQGDSVNDNEESGPEETAGREDDKGEAGEVGGGPGKKQRRPRSSAVGRGNVTRGDANGGTRWQGDVSPLGMEDGLPHQLSDPSGGKPPLFGRFSSTYTDRTGQATTGGSQNEATGAQIQGGESGGGVEGALRSGMQNAVGEEKSIAEFQVADPCEEEGGTEVHQGRAHVGAEGSNEARQTDCSPGQSRKMDVDVEVVSWRERRIAAVILIHASMERVWEVLTDYEKLAEFIPNLVRSERIPCPHPGRVWLLQQGMQQAMYWHIEARVVLDLQEYPCTPEGKELHFEMVDGDFKRYAGKWSLLPACGGTQTLLKYEVNVIPQLLLPTIFLERIIKADLPKNLWALADRAEGRAQAQAQLPALANQPEDSCNAGPQGRPGPALSAQLAEKPSGNMRQGEGMNFGGKTLAQLGPISGNLGTDRTSDGQSKDVLSGDSGIASKEVATAAAGEAGSPRSSSVAVAAPPASEDALASEGSPASQILKGLTWGRVDPSKFGGAGGSCRLGKTCRADEIHLRRLDDLLEKGGGHRRVVASITIQASAEEVWRVLTDYERLPEFIPNLAASKVIYKDKNKVQLLQEGCKCLMYMVLHARVVLELRERSWREIQFEQVEGDFEAFHGRWLLEPQGARHTQLKYAVETKMRPETILAEAIVEEVVYEDLPANLCAIRDRVEEFREQELAKRGGQGIVLMPRIRRRERTTADMAAELAATDSVAAEPTVVPRPLVPKKSEDLPPSRQPMKQQGVGPESSVGQEPEAASQRRAVRGLLTDFKVLEGELTAFVRMHGKPGVMPKRPELRRNNRTDLEKAIARMGGFEAVARQMGLRMAYQRKPRRYWEDFNTIRAEVLQFQQESGGSPSLMPSRKSLERAGRYDLARALEKWGGLGEVARLLKLGVRRRKTRNIFSEDTPSEEASTSENARAQEPEGERKKADSLTRRRSSQKALRKDAKPDHEGSADVATEEEGSPKPMKAPVPASSRKWVAVWKKYAEPKDGPDM